MKKNLLSALTVCLTVIAFSQSKQYVLFEHFTQASCGPCALQNPAFEAVRSENLSVTHHVAYHTSWPGIDPMHDLNPADVANQVDYYGVSGVPDMNMLGSTWNGGPAGVTGSQIQAASSGTAPVRLRITDTDMGSGDHQVLVELMETGNLSGSNLRLRVAVVERHIEYAAAPGTNGELDFPNVFRAMISGTDGTSVTPMGPGNIQEFIFDYPELPEYNMDEIYILAWLQDDNGGVVINSGSSLDPNWQVINQSQSTFNSGSGNSLFSSVYQSDETDQNLNIELTTDAPSDWSGVVIVDGIIYADQSFDVAVSNALAEMQIEVTPGATAGIGNYTLTVTNLSHPDDAPTILTYTVMAGITDLVVVNGYNDGAGNPFNWDEDYTNGLDATGNTSYALLDINKFIEGVNASAMDEVNNIYYNISWTFPSFTDEKVAALETFLDAGKNMFVSGQDVGWDTWEGNGTAVTQGFYTDYLSTQYDGDGNAGNSQLTWVGDPVFDLATGSTIVNAYPQGNYIYPDELTPLGNAVSVFNYNGDPTKSGCIRVDENGHKIVYLGIDTRMIDDEAVRSQVIAISHDWFYGIISSLEYDVAIREALGQNYPNPAVQTTIIPLSDLGQEANITVLSVDGKLIHQGRVAAGQVNYELDVTGLSTGSYLYYLTTEEGRSESFQMQVEK